MVCRAALPLAPLGFSVAHGGVPLDLAARRSYQRQERVQTRLRRERRRALWLATYGIDVGPRVIHGMAVR